MLPPSAHHISQYLDLAAVYFPPFRILSPTSFTQISFIPFYLFKLFLSICYFLVFYLSFLRSWFYYFISFSHSSQLAMYTTFPILAATTRFMLRRLKVIPCSNTFGLLALMLQIFETLATRSQPRSP